MPESRKVTFYHSPRTRSTGTLILLEELGASYELKIINMTADEQRQPAFLAINPMGKVPAIVHNGTLVTEQVAITLYLADLYPEAKLAPAIGDQRRGSYLRWLVFYAACFEPAVVDRAMKREPGPPRMSTYGDFDTMLKTVASQLAAGPYLLGDQVSAADILWGTGLGWTTQFKLVPELPEIMAYVGRIKARPAVAAIAARDAELAAALEARS